MIKKWSEFNESISGTTDTKTFGMIGGEPDSPTTLDRDYTSIVSSGDGKFYTESDFIDLYNDILKTHKEIIISKGVDITSLRKFNKENLDFLLSL